MLDTFYYCFHLTLQLTIHPLKSMLTQPQPALFATVEAHSSSGAILTYNINYSSAVTHIAIIKVVEGWIPEKFKITASTIVLIANTIYLGRNSWWNEYILFYSWEDDRCLWQVWCLHTSFIVLSITSLGTWNIHVPKKSKNKTNHRRRWNIVSTFLINQYPLEFILTCEKKKGESFALWKNWQASWRSARCYWQWKGSFTLVVIRDSVNIENFWLF